MSIRQLSTHGLGEEQLKSKFKVALNRMSISWTWWLDKYILFVSCMPEDKGGGGVSKNHVEVKGGVNKNHAWHLLHCTSPPLPINNVQSLNCRNVKWTDYKSERNVTKHSLNRVCVLLLWEEKLLHVSLWQSTSASTSPSPPLFGKFQHGAFASKLRAQRKRLHCRLASTSKLYSYNMSIGNPKFNVSDARRRLFSRLFKGSKHGSSYRG